MKIVQIVTLQSKGEFATSATWQDACKDMHDAVAKRSLSYKNEVSLLSLSKDLRVQLTGRS